MLVRLTGITPDKNLYKNCFSDVKQESFASAICFAKDQGWLEGFSTNLQTLDIWQFVPTVNAQGLGEKFNPETPVKTSEAVGSLSRLMKWKVTTRGKNSNEEVVNLAKEHKIIEDNKPEANLTKGEAAGVIHRSLTTVSLGNDKFTPALGREVESYKIENLIDLDPALNRQRQLENERIRKARQIQMAEVIGQKAAAEIMAIAGDDSNLQVDLYLKKRREKNYEEMLAEDKTRWGEAPSFNVFEPL